MLEFLNIFSAFPDPYMWNNFHMWVVFATIILAIILFTRENIALEISALIVLVILLLFFETHPMLDAQGNSLLDTSKLLMGFANPALIAVMSLLILGQSVIRTGALNGVTNLIMKVSRGNFFFALVIILTMVTAFSGFLNDTPTCVVFIPVLMAVAKEFDMSASKVMIPLSYAAILGGVTTLVGSSTNLLVSGALVELGLPALEFFEFTLPGVIIAGTGLIYCIFVLPHLLPKRAPLASELVGDGDRQFVAQLELDYSSDFVGKTIDEAEIFENKDMTLKMIQRGEHAFLPPFDGTMKIEAHDILILSTTKQAITDLLAEKPQSMFRKIHKMSMDLDEKEKDDSMVAEVLIAPASRIIGQNIEQIGFHHNYNCVVLGIQRRSRVITSRMTEIRLAAGDVLLVMGSPEDVMAMRENKDFILMEWSTHDLPSKKLAWRVNAIFLGVVGAAAFKILPIHISALIGVALVILTGCINLRQAQRSLDLQIVMMVAAGLALSVSLEKTGGAAYLANNLVHITQGLSPTFIMSAMFLMMAIFTNILSNNATALLFTPIAVSTAATLNVEPQMFIYAVIFASNCCSFASPIGYQTNLLVMAPGHYKFSDYLRGGLPLMFIVWITYTAFSWFYFGYR